MIKGLSITFIISAVSVIIFTPAIRRIALALGVVDKPGKRKIHRQNMPTLGGVAIAAGFYIGTLFIFRAIPGAMDRFLFQFNGICIGSAIIIILGAIDDVRPLSAKPKFFIQIIAASVLMGAGFIVEEITVPLFGRIPLGYFGVIFSTLWIVGITNAINLLDGLDGLAAGVSGIAAFFMFLSAVIQRDYVVAFLAIALSGACAGFLPFNFYPARIFMGNSGSMFLGFVLSAVSIVSFQKSKTLITLFIPIIALGLPIIDTALAIIRRLVKKRRIFRGDREHIHHRILFRSVSQRKAVLSLYFLSVCFGLIAISFRGITGIYAIAAVVIVVLGIFKWMKDSGFLDFK